MNPAHIPSLPDLDTQATIQDYFAISGASAGPAWPHYFPLSEWREHVPTLPAGTHGMVLSSDHSSNKGRWYLGTSEDYTTWTFNTTTPVFTDATDIQTEMPVLALNRRLRVLEVYPHYIGGLYGWTNQQDDQLYHTTDFSTFSLQGDVLVDGAYSPAHPGYGKIVEDENKTQWWIKAHSGAEHTTNAVLRRDVHAERWQFDGRQLSPNQTHVSGARNRCFVGTHAFQWMGQWYRLAMLTVRPRVTISTSNQLALVAYPVLGPPDLDTPIGGYQTLVEEASGFILQNNAFAVVDPSTGTLYVYYTERNSSTSQNRIRVAYNSTGEYNPKAASPATHTAPTTPIYSGGRLWPQRAATTRYVQGRNEGTPSWATLTQESGTAAVSQTQNGYRITSGSTTAIWNWGVKSANAINPASGGVLVAEWKGLRSSGLATQGYQFGFQSANGNPATGNSVLLFGTNLDAGGFRQTFEWLEYRSSSVVVQDVATYAWDAGSASGIYVDWHNQRPRDLKIAIFDAGTKFAAFIDGSLVTYGTLHATAIGAVIPFIRSAPNSPASAHWMEWEGFEFAALNDGEHIDGHSLDQIEAMIQRAVLNGERAQRQIRDDAFEQRVKTPITAERCTPAYTYHYPSPNSLISPRIITENNGFAGDICFDFTNLTGGVALQGATVAVAAGSGTAPVLSNVRLTDDLQQVMVNIATVDGTTGEETWRLTCTATRVDNVVDPRLADFVVE